MKINYEIREFDLKQNTFLVRYSDADTQRSISLNLPLPIRNDVLLVGEELDAFIRAFMPRAEFAGGVSIEDIDTSAIEALIAPPTMEEIAGKLLFYIDEHLDKTARERNYDSVLTICTYGDTGNAKFDAEGIAFKRWRSRVWERCYALQDEVLSGERPVPTKEEMIALLPKMEWPS